MVYKLIMTERVRITERSPVTDDGRVRLVLSRGLTSEEVREFERLATTQGLPASVARGSFGISISDVLEVNLPLHPDDETVAVAKAREILDAVDAIFEHLNPANAGRAASSATNEVARAIDDWIREHA